MFVQTTAACVNEAKEAKKMHNNLAPFSSIPFEALPEGTPNHAAGSPRALRFVVDQAACVFFDAGGWQIVITRGQEIKTGRLFKSIMGDVFAMFANIDGASSKDIYFFESFFPRGK